MTMLAFHNDKKIKARLLRQLKAHYDADEIIQGQYWENGKGCAVGCTIHSDDHSLYESQLGIPQTIARLEDCIFEGLKNGVAKQWPQRFTKAIQPGADLSLVWPRFALWMLREKLPEWTTEKDILAAIEQTALVYENWIMDGLVDSAAAQAADAAAQAAAQAADAAAQAAADAAAQAAAEAAAHAAAHTARAAHAAAHTARAAAYAAAYAAYAARAAAYAAAYAAYAADAAYAARAAAYAAAYAADAADAAADFWAEASDKLIQLLKATEKAK